MAFCQPNKVVFMVKVLLLQSLFHTESLDG